MWTEQSRGRMAKIAKKTKRYSSDLTDEEWEPIAPLMPKTRTAGASAGSRVPGGDQYGALPGALGLRLANAAGPLRSLAHGLRLVPGTGPPLSVPDDPRRRADAGPRASRARGEPVGGGDRQPVGQGSARRNTGLRRRQENFGAQASHRGGH